MRRGIFWLASYPKSGNTWFRVFLTNLLHAGDGPASINDLETSAIASAREIFDELTGFDACDLTADEIDRLRPELYCHLAENAGETLFIKVHDAYTFVTEDTPLLPKKATAGAIYIIRNPLDVAVSFAHHSGWDYDTTIKHMADETFSFCGTSNRLYRQLRQKLLSWNRHILSWVDSAPFPVCVLRYEDMKWCPLETFSRAARFAGIERSPAQIQKALEFSAFDVVRKQEETDGFREKSPASASFFRKGEVGSWREELTSEQAQRIVRDHREVMRRFGYLSAQGEITCRKRKGVTVL